MRAFSGALAAALLVGVTRSAVAFACGPSAPPYYIDDHHAPSGTGTPLNAPIVVTLREDPSGPVSDSFNPQLTLTKAGSDLAVELKALGGAPTLVWVPVEPLEPETAYQVHFNPGYEGIPDTSWPFTTGTEPAPALSLEGKLEVTFEPGTDTLYTCTGVCGGCTSEVVGVTKARVKIPRAFDGFPRRFGSLWLTDDKPYDFSQASKTAAEPYQGRNVSVVEYADLDDPSVTDVLITVPHEELAYKPCFAFAASDARGDQATIEPLCLDAPVSPLVDENHDHPALTEDPKKSGTSRGCSLGTNPSSDGAWLVLLAPLALLRGSRRRLSTGLISAGDHAR